MYQMKENYITSIQKQFEYYKSLSEKTFEQLSDEELFWKHDSESNSIAMIVNHLWGNMLSRWTDFLTSDGEKEWRNRDMEFEDVIRSRVEMMKKWEEGWKKLFDALELITPENLETIVYIRNQGHTVTEALNRQLAHYSYHIGQIVFIGKMIRGDRWKSLSIPKGGSNNYNQEKFKATKHTEHFTEEYIHPRNKP